MTPKTNIPSLNRVLTHIRTELERVRGGVDRALASLGVMPQVQAATVSLTRRQARAHARRRPVRAQKRPIAIGKQAAKEATPKAA